MYKYIHVILQIFHIYKYVWYKNTYIGIHILNLQKTWTLQIMKIEYTVKILIKHTNVKACCIHNNKYWEHKNSYDYEFGPDGNKGKMLPTIWPYKIVYIKSVFNKILCKEDQVKDHKQVFWVVALCLFDIYFKYLSNLKLLSSFHNDLLNDIMLGISPNSICLRTDYRSVFDIQREISVDGQRKGKQDDFRRKDYQQFSLLVMINKAMYQLKYHWNYRHLN